MLNPWYRWLTGIGLLLISCTDPRTEFFPSTKILEQDMPSKDSVWVVLLAGQSNMAGYGLVKPDDTLSMRRVVVLNKQGRIEEAKEPIHDYIPEMRGKSCARSFASQALKCVPDGVSLLLVPCAIRGSSILDWLEDGEVFGTRVYSNFKTMVSYAERFGEFKALLWHQGESDANEGSLNEHRYRLGMLFTKIRHVTRTPELPIFIGELGNYGENLYGWRLINDEIHEYAHLDTFTFVVPAEGLYDMGDKVHLNGESLDSLGTRFANSFCKYEQALANSKIMKQKRKF
jgi:hypothetical protein